MHDLVEGIKMSEEEMREGQGGRAAGPEPGSEQVGATEASAAGPIHQRCSCMVQAEHAEINRGLAGMVQAERVELNQSAALAVVARDATVKMGGSLITAASNLTVDRGGSQWLVAGEARVHQGGAGIVVTRHAHLTDSKVGILLAGRVDGKVQALMSNESALRFGAALGATLGVAVLLRRLLWGR